MEKIATNLEQYFLNQSGHYSKKGRKDYEINK